MRKYHPLGTGCTTAEAFELEAADARTRGGARTRFGLAYLATGLTRTDAGATGFARACTLTLGNF